MRRLLVAVYALAALVAAAPAIVFVGVAAGFASRVGPLVAALALLLNPVVICSFGLAAWFASIAWRQASASVRPTPAELGSAEVIAALLGASLAWAGLAAIAANEASAARGGGLLGGLGERSLIVGTAYLLLAGASFAVRAFGFAPRARHGSRGDRSLSDARRSLLAKRRR